MAYVTRGPRRRKAKVVAAVWMTELIQFLAALAIMHQDERMNKKMATWLNGCFEKWMIIWLTPTHQHGCSLKKLLHKSSLKCSIQVPPAATTFAFSSVFILLL